MLTTIMGAANGSIHRKSQARPCRLRQFASEDLDEAYCPLWTPNQVDVLIPYCSRFVSLDDLRAPIAQRNVGNIHVGGIRFAAYCQALDIPGSHSISPPPSLLFVLRAQPASLVFPRRELPLPLFQTFEPARLAWKWSRRWRGSRH